MNLENQFTRNITKYKTNKVYGLFTKKINRSFMYNFNTYGVKVFKLPVKVIKTEIFLQTLKVLLQHSNHRLYILIDSFLNFRKRFCLIIH